MKGFYAGNGCFKVRFLPLLTGEYDYRVSGLTGDSGSIFAEPADKKHHGPVGARGTHLYYDGGRAFHSFGTTVYALANQEKELVDQTIDTLSKAPFNKVRMCAFRGKRRWLFWRSLSK